METLDGYGIQNSILFETGHGFILAQAKDRDKGFMVWQFTETPFGRDFYHGRSFVLTDEAERDYRRRAKTTAESGQILPLLLYAKAGGHRRLPQA